MSTEIRNLGNLSLWTKL